MAAAAGAFDAPRAVAVSSADLLAGRVVVREQLDGLEPATESDGFTTAVSWGCVIAAHDLRIVDPETRQERAAGQVGEIWLSGPSVAAGFWRKPEATEETFKARLVDPTGAEPERDPGPDYLRTGDLGALLDGELYVLGRIKDMVIVHGRNLYATDLETTASASHASLGADRTIAFSVGEDSEERLVLVHELSQAAQHDLDAPGLFQVIRAAVLREHEIDPSAILLVRPATLPLSGERLAREMAYWRDQLQGAPTAISLPADRSRPAEMDYRGGTVPFEIPADIVSGLQALARSRGATLFMVLQAAFAALLHRLGGGEDMVIGTAVAGRPRMELEALAGFFVNTLALRHRPRGEMRFTDLLDATRAMVLSAFEHQAVPFEAVVEAVRPVRSLSHAPLFQVMLVLQNQDGAAAGQDLDLPDVAVTPVAVDGETAQFDLSLDIAPAAAGLEGSLSYASALFDAATAQRLAARFGLLLAGIAAAPETLVAALPVMDTDERALVVSGFNATAVDYPRDRTVLDLFEARAGTQPDAVAVVDGARQVSYGALASASRRLGRHLIGLGVGPEVMVGVCLDRSAELIVSLLGVFQAGGA